MIDAINQNVSDIHFEPYNDKFRVRFRVDGLLHEYDFPPPQQKNAITARLKVLSNLDIAEKRLPQDGRFQLNNMFKKSMDFRISTCPTINGEKIVLRILESQSDILNINQLGMNENQKTHFFNAIHKSQGLILVTGPTGSGKTITLYSALDYLNKEEKNISTVEDPIEIQLSGINQVQINPKIGLTFSHTLRTFLRQDPDILMIGEIRDTETAETAIRAAQTGHLVLSTLHTNSAIESLSRLHYLGINLHNMIDSIELIVSQRLVRKSCIHCKNGQDCQYCKKGYKGRTGIFEMLPFSIEHKQCIHSNENMTRLMQKLKEEKLMNLWDSGIEKVKQGITTMDELKRIL